MDKTKKLYFMLMFISVFLVSTMCFSYAFFTSKTEGNGKLNIVAGTLDYKIESDELENNKLTLNSGEVKEIEISLKSLNEISSKYELYYVLNIDNDNIRIGYSEDTKNSVLGTIEANETKKITIIARNTSNEDAEVTFGVVGGLSNNELTLTVGKSLNQIVEKYLAYSIGDEITLIDGSKWHVLENSSESEETVVLLSDYHLNSDGTYNDKCGANIDSNYTCSPMAFDSDNTNKYDESDSNNIGYFIKNTYAPKVKALLPGTTEVTLPTVKQMVEADGELFDSSQTIIPLKSSWILTTSYWTQTSSSVGSSFVWRIIGSSSRTYANVAESSNSCGARPTITTPKSNIVETFDSTTELSIGTAVEAIDGSKWHVLENSNSDSKYVTLLSDYNLNSDGTYNTSCGRDINSIFACNTMFFDPDGTNIYDENDSNNIGYFVKNTFGLKLKLLETSNITIPTAYQLIKTENKEDQFDYLSSSALLLTNSWLLTTNYWTKTSGAVNTSVVWYLSGEHTSLDDGRSINNTSLGARPVITTLKTNLLAQ